jgi:hypothetical protein
MLLMEVENRVNVLTGQVEDQDRHAMYHTNQIYHLNQLLIEIERENLETQEGLIRAQGMIIKLRLGLMVAVMMGLLAGILGAWIHHT